MTKAPPKVRGKLGMIDLDTVKRYPNNPRLGDLSLIKESIVEIGFLSPIVVQKSSMYIVAGNHRVDAAKDLDMEEVPGYIVDIDDTTAKRFLAVDNRANDKAGYDEELLATLLDELLSADETNLRGTGYSKAEAQEIIEAAPWQDQEIVEKVTVPKVQQKLEPEAVDIDVAIDAEEMLTDFLEAPDDSEHIEKAAEGTEERKKPKPKEAQLTTRPIVLTWPATKFKPVIDAMAAGKEKANVRTNEEFIVFLLQRSKLLDSDFVLYEGME